MEKSFHSKASEALEWIGQYFDVMDQEYWGVKAGRPQWVADMIQEACTIDGRHVFMNDKFRLRFIAESLMALEDPLHETIDKCIPDLVIDDSLFNCLLWASSHRYRTEVYIEKHLGDNRPLKEAITFGMQQELYDVFASVSHFIDGFVKYGTDIDPVEE